MILTSAELSKLSSSLSSRSNDEPLDTWPDERPPLDSLTCIDGRLSRVHVMALLACGLIVARVRHSDIEPMSSGSRAQRDPALWEDPKTRVPVSSSRSSGVSHFTEPSRSLCRTMYQPAQSQSTISPSSASLFSSDFASIPISITTSAVLVFSSATWIVTTTPSWSNATGHSTRATRYTSASNRKARRVKRVDSLFCCMSAGP
mmetsp:Transcript_18899/g.56661  ORF Transcript_18899/g.56661 Transcript_18899/m.56661 type:complete len:203 (+) Transcript_18899:651-1259(+)